MSDKHTDAQGELPMYEVVFQSIAAATVVAGNAVAVSVKDFNAALAVKGYEIRATEDQAQTGAAVDANQLAAIHGLIAVANAAYHLMDNTEESGPVGDSVFTHQGDDNEYLSESLDHLDALPDDQPGYVMGPCAKAEWALRGILAAQVADSTAPGAPVDRNAVLEEIAAYHDQMQINTSGSRAAWVHAESARHMRSLKRAAPTAQQSLTAGGAVLELFITAKEVLYLIDACGDKTVSFKYDDPCILRLGAALLEVESSAADTLQQAQIEALKDHHHREFVNDLRDIAIQFYASGQLRARLSDRVGDFIAKHAIADQQPVTPSRSRAVNDGGVA